MADKQIITQRSLALQVNIDELKNRDKPKVKDIIYDGLHGLFEAPTRPEEKKRGQTRKEERDGKRRRLNFGSF